MKILMTTDAIGGVWHYAIDLVQHLMSEQIEVVLVCMGPEPGMSKQETVERLQKKGLIFYHRPYRLEWMDDPWEDIEQANAWIRMICEKEKPSLLHFNNYAPAGMDWSIPSVLVAHSCLASWWHEVKKEKLPDRYQRYFKTVQKAFQKADTVIFPSMGLLDACKQLYGQIRDPRVVYNGLAFSFSDSLHEFNSKMPIAFSMGRLWDEAKNIGLLLRAAPDIEGEIFIAGVKSEDISCPRNVRFLGELTRQQVLNWLKISAVYVLPVKYEPFGLSFLEAASCQCALVGGDIPTLREIWGESMTYVHTDDPKELSSTCNALLSDPFESRWRGEEAYQTAKKYPLSEKTARYMKIYRELLGAIPETVPLT